MEAEAYPEIEAEAKAEAEIEAEAEAEAEVKAEAEVEADLSIAVEHLPPAVSLCRRGTQTSTLANLEEE